MLNFPRPARRFQLLVFSPVSRSLIAPRPTAKPSATVSRFSHPHPLVPSCSAGTAAADPSSARSTLESRQVRRSPSAERLWLQPPSAITTETPPSLVLPALRRLAVLFSTPDSSRLGILEFLHSSRDSTLPAAARGKWFRPRATRFSKRFRLPPDQRVESGTRLRPPWRWHLQRVGVINFN